MRISEVTENKKQYIELLLLADEQEDMIDRYLDRGRMFILDDGGVKAECVVTDEGNGILELKNIAVRPDFHRRGYGRALIEYIADAFRDRYSALQVGTGDVPSSLGFYGKCGFAVSGRIKNFFTDNYDHLMFEDGVQLVDMVYLSRSLKQKQGGRLCKTDIFGEGLSNAMVRGCHANCRAALEKAVQDGLIRINPAIGCKLPPKKAREMQVLTREEMQRFLIQAKEGYYELFLLELATVLRRGEITALQWDDLNFDTGELSITKQVYRAKGELVITEPKTKSSIRKLILPQGLLDVLRDYRQGVHSRWMFPSPVKEDSPLDPATCRNRLSLILKHAGCKGLRFHDLRRTFSTTALEHGMDVKTLSALLGHVSSATTLNIYTHITDNMRQDAAAKIDRGIGKAEPESAGKGKAKEETQRTVITFQPYKGEKRRAGTGCISQISDHLWEGRYSPMWPDGKKRSRNVYAHTREECEAMLPGLIAEMKAEIAAIKAGGASAMAAIPDGISKKKKAIAEYMRANPTVKNKCLIARESGTSRWTVQKYYDEIRKTMRPNAAI